MRSEMLNQVLDELNSSSPDIEGTAVISIDGLPIASLLVNKIDDERVGAMSAAILSLGDRTVEELARGSLEQVLVKGEEGYVLLTHAGEDAVLTVLAQSGAILGSVFLDVRSAVGKIKQII